MVHCHNLPHEDHDMMHQFSVGLNDGEVDDERPDLRPTRPVTTTTPEGRACGRAAGFLTGRSLVALTDIEPG